MLCVYSGSVCVLCLSPVWMQAVLGSHLSMLLLRLCVRVLTRLGSFRHCFPMCCVYPCRSLRHFHCSVSCQLNLERAIPLLGLLVFGTQFDKTAVKDLQYWIISCSHRAELGCTLGVALKPMWGGLPYKISNVLIFPLVLCLILIYISTTRRAWSKPCVNLAKCG